MFLMTHFLNTDKSEGKKMDINTQNKGYIYMYIRSKHRVNYFLLMDHFVYEMVFPNFKLFVNKYKTRSLFTEQ